MPKKLRPEFPKISDSYKFAMDVAADAQENIVLHQGEDDRNVLIKFFKQTKDALCVFTRIFKRTRTKDHTLS